MVSVSQHRLYGTLPTIADRAGAEDQAGGLNLEATAPRKKAKQMTTVLEMGQHILDLCAEHKIYISWCPRPSQASGSLDDRAIDIAPTKSPISYACALHEIGHVLDRHQKSNDFMVCERGAWRWAKANALAWTPAMDRLVAKCLAGHAAGELRRRQDRERSRARWRRMKPKMIASLEEGSVYHIRRPGDPVVCHAEELALKLDAFVYTDRSGVWIYPHNYDETDAQ
jgi:hypothetical protein